MNNNWHRAGAAALSLALLCGITAEGAQAQKRSKSAASAGETIVATVNGQKISLEEIVDKIVADDKMLATITNPMFMQRKNGQQIAPLVGTIALSKMSEGGSSTVTRAEILTAVMKEKPPTVLSEVQNRIREVVVQQEAKKRNVQVSEAEVSKQVTKDLGQARERMRMTGATDKQILKEAGIRESAYRNAIRIALLLEKIVLGDLEVKFKHKVGAGDFIEASHLLVSAKPPAATQPDPTKPPVQPTEADKEKAFQEARTKILAHAEDIKSKKKTFDDLAIENEDATKFKKGNLGVFLRGQMVPEFNEAVFSLQPGVVSDPVRTAFGWHLIRVERLGKDIPASERDPILQSYVRQLFQTKVQELVTKAKITNKLPVPQPGPGMPPGQ